MIFRYFNHSLGCRGFELNFIGKNLNLRIASRQFSLWRGGKPIFDFRRFKKGPRESVVEKAN